MRILHLNLEKGWRGGERQTLLTLRGLRAGGHEVALCSDPTQFLDEAKEAKPDVLFAVRGGVL